MKYFYCKANINSLATWVLGMQLVCVIVIRICLKKSNGRYKSLSPTVAHFASNKPRILYFRIKPRSLILAIFIRHSPKLSFYLPDSGIRTIVFPHADASICKQTRNQVVYSESVSYCLLFRGQGGYCSFSFTGRQGQMKSVALTTPSQSEPQLLP